MATSQNGWPVIFNSGDNRLTRIPKIIGKVRDGDVAVILTDMVLWIDQHIEDVDAGRDDWGGNVRPIRGKTRGYSNHASYTAMDVNALRHPRGAINTFAAAQRKAIRARLKYYEGVLRWGGDYSLLISKRDDMHFEINAGSAAVKRVADKIRRENNGAVEEVTKPTGSTKPAPKTKAVWKGLSVQDTKKVQKYLRSVDLYTGKIDGVYGEMTRAAVKAYQQRAITYGGAAVKADGYWGPLTQRWFDWVRDTLQPALAKWKASQRLGKLRRDGDYGPLMAKHVKEIQSDNWALYKRHGGGVADGQAGKITCRMLGIPAFK